MTQLITVKNFGFISQMGMNGPIVTPTRTPVKTVNLLVKNGYNVFLHNEINPNESVKLTLTNLEAKHFEYVPANTSEEAVGEEVKVITNEETTETEEVETEEVEEESEENEEEEMIDTEAGVVTPTTEAVDMEAVMESNTEEEEAVAEPGTQPAQNKNKNRRNKNK